MPGPDERHSKEALSVYLPGGWRLEFQPHGRGFLPHLSAGASARDESPAAARSGRGVPAGIRDEAGLFRTAPLPASEPGNGRLLRREDRAPRSEEHTSELQS